MADQSPIPPVPNPQNSGGDSPQGHQPPQSPPQKQSNSPANFGNASGAQSQGQGKPIPPGTQGAQAFPQQPPPGFLPPSGGGQSVGAQGQGFPPPPPLPIDPNARIGQLKTRGKHIFKIPPHPNTTFDEEYFLTLLEGSISLTIEEKQRVIDAIPHLRIEQINELISIFEEERQKFSDLESEFADDVQRLKQEREREIETAETKQEEATEEADAADEAAALKKELGL